MQTQENGVRNHPFQFVVALVRKTIDRPEQRPKEGGRSRYHILEKRDHLYQVRIFDLGSGKEEFAACEILMGSEGLWLQPQFEVTGAEHLPK